MSARKSSDRSHRMRDDGELNLTSLMDIITNLMFFLLIFANLIPVVIIDAPLPKVAQTAEEVRQAKKQENDLEIILRIKSDGFLVQTNRGRNRKFNLLSTNEYPFEELHQYLIGLHQKNRNKKDLTIIPEEDTKYDIIIRSMDASREYVKGDPGFQALPQEVVGRPESQKFNRLFPDVSIGGV